MTQLPVPGRGGLGTDGITTGPDGGIWFTASSGNFIGRIDPNNPSSVQEFPLPTPDAAPTDITVGPDGNLWFVETAGGRIGRILAAAPHTISEFATPTPNSDPDYIAAGPDGNVWFDESVGNHVARILTTAPNTITEFPLPKPHPELGAIVAGADGNMWYGASCGATTSDPYCATSGAYMARILTGAPNSVTEFKDSGAAGSAPVAIPGVIRQGNFLWFTEAGGNNISRISSTGQNTITQWALPTDQADPQGLVAADGSIFIAERAANKIGRLDTGALLSNNPIDEIPVPTPAGSTGAAPLSMTLGPDGAIWFTNANANTIGRLDPRRLVPALHTWPGLLPAGPSTTAGPSTAQPATTTVAHVVPCPDTTPTCPAHFMTQMATAPDGSLWFTAASASFIGHVYPSRPDSIVEYPMPAGGAMEPYGMISVARDGRLWFGLDDGGASGSGAIAVINPRIADPAKALTEYSLPAAFPGGHSVVVAPDGSVWFTNAGGIVGRLDPRSPNPAASVVAVASVGVAHELNGITVGPDGNIWYGSACLETPDCTSGNSAVGRILSRPPYTRTEWLIRGGFDLGATGVRNLVAAGGAVYFDEDGANKIGRITVGANNQLMQWTLPDNRSYPWQIVADHEGNIWMAELIGGPTSAGQVGELRQNGLLSLDPFTDYALPPAPDAPAGSLNPGPTGIAVANDDSIWFTDALHNYLEALHTP